MGYPASDPIYDPFYDVSLDHDMPVLVLVGYTGSGAGIPGGGGVKLDLCHPRYVDELAINYPTLKIIAGRPAWPWQDEMIAVMLHKPNVWAELHGWSPKYLTEPLKRDIRAPPEEPRDVRRRLSAVPLRAPGRRLEDAGLRGRHARGRVLPQRRDAVRAAVQKLRSAVALAALSNRGSRTEGSRAVVGGSSRASASPSPTCSRPRARQWRWSRAAEKPLEAAARIAASEDRRTRARRSPPTSGKAEDCARIIESARSEFGRIDMLVNNDGAPPLGRLDEFDDAAWDKAVQQNLMSVVRLDAACAAV